jgi:DNA-binding LacI/PurR family transcriptional regulator
MTIIALLGSPEQEKKVLHQMRRGLADGIILNSPVYMKSDEIATLAQSGCAVAIYSNHLSPSGVDIVKNNENEMSQVALKYLYHKGHRRIAYIGNFSVKNAPMLRYDTYLNFMSAYSLPIEDGFLQFDLGISRENAYYQAMNFLRLPKPPDAIFAGSDLAAISTIQAITNSGLRIPDDIAVIGSGNIPEGELMHPTLTTIGPPKIDFSMLVYFLFSRLQGEAPPEGRQHCIQWQFIQRESA